jgi:hypothetical protein
VHSINNDASALSFLSTFHMEELSGLFFEEVFMCEMVRHLGQYITLWNAGLIQSFFEIQHQSFSDTWL